MADSLFDFIEKNQNDLITPEDELFKKAQGEAAKTPQGQVANALSAEAEQLEQPVEPHGVGTELANVLARPLRGLVGGTRRALAGATEFASELAEGQRYLQEIDDPDSAMTKGFEGARDYLSGTSDEIMADEAAADLQLEKDRPLQTTLGKYTGEAMQSIGAMAPAFVVGAVSKNPMAATYVMGNMTGLETFKQGKADGLSTEAAMGQAVAAGAAEGIFETMPTGMLFSWFKKGKKGFAKHLKDYFKYVGAEIATEIPTTWVQSAADIFYSQADTNPEQGAQDVKDYLKGIITGQGVDVDGRKFDAQEEAAHTAIVTALQSSILGGAAKGVAGVSRKLDARREEKAVSAEQQTVAANLTADHMGNKVNEEADARKDVVFTEAEAESIRRGERTVEDVVAGHSEVSINDDAQTVDESMAEQAQQDISDNAEEEAGAIEEEASEQIDQINEFNDAVNEDAENEAAGRKKVITNWATGEWEWSDDEAAKADEEILDKPEAAASTELKVDTHEFKTAARSIYARAKTFAQFSAELVKQFGAKVKKHAVKLWGAYKKSKFSSQTGAVGDVENVPQSFKGKESYLDDLLDKHEDGTTIPDADLSKLQAIVDTLGASPEDGVLRDEIQGILDEASPQPVSTREVDIGQGYEDVPQFEPEGLALDAPQMAVDEDQLAIDAGYLSAADMEDALDQEKEKKGPAKKTAPVAQPSKALEKKPVTEKKPKKKSHVERETKEEKEFGVGGESGIDAKKTRGPKAKTIKPGKKAHELKPKTAEDKSDALKREEENIKLEREIEELVNKARTDKEVSDLFDAIERKNQIEHRTGDAPAGAETEAELSGYVSLVKDDQDLDIEAPFKGAVHKGEDTGSPEMRLIRQQELRFSGLRDIKDLAYWRATPTRPKSERERTDYGFRKADLRPLTDKELANYKKYQKEELEKQTMMKAQVLILLTGNSKLMITDHKVVPHTMQQIMKAIDQKKKLGMTTPRDEIYRDILNASKTFYTGDIINFIKKEEGIHSLAQLEGYPTSLGELLQRAEQGKVKAEEHKEILKDVVAETAEANPNAVKIFNRLLNTVFGKLTKEQADNILKNSNRANKLFNEINSAQARANERALSLILIKPDQVLAFFEANLYADGKYEDKQWFKDQLRKDFGIEFGKEITKKGHTQPVATTPVVFDALIEWSKLERKSMQTEDRKAMESFIEEMMQGRLPKNEEEAIMDKAITDGVKVAVALESARKSKGKVAVTHQEKKDQRRSDAPRIGVRKVATKAQRMIEAKQMQIKRARGSKAKRAVREQLRDSFYGNLMDLTSTKLFSNKVATVNAGTFYRALQQQATQGRHGKANFLNVEEIARKMSDETKLAIKTPEFKAMSIEARKNDPAMLFLRLSIPEQEKLVKFYITMSEPRTGSWEALFYNPEVSDLTYEAGEGILDPKGGFKGGISFTAENALETHTIEDRASFTQIDPSAQRAKNTPTINEKGYNLTDVTLTDGTVQLALSATELKELGEEDTDYKVKKVRKSNTGNLVEVQFFSGKEKFEKQGWRAPILMTQAEFDKMERKHDENKHEAYEVIEQPAGSKQLTVENAGMGKMISGWDFLNNIQALADRANEMTNKQGNEILPKDTYSEIQFDLETARVIDLLLDTLEGEQLDSDLLGSLDPLTGKNESGEQINERDELTAMKWANKGKDSRLAANMIVVKSLLMSEQIKKDTIRNPDWFQQIATHYSITGKPDTEWLRLYLEEAGGNRDRFMTIVKQEVENAYQKQADALLVGQKRMGRVGTSSAKYVRDFILGRLDETESKAYMDVIEGRKTLGDLKMKERVLVEAYRHLEARLLSAPVKGYEEAQAKEKKEKYAALAAGETSVADFLSDMKVAPKVWDFYAEKNNLSEYEANLDVNSVGEIRDPDAKKFYDQIAKAFGVEFILVSDPAYRSKYDPNNGKPKIIVNVKSDTSFHKIMGHEIFHHVVNRASRGQIETFKKAIRALSNKNLDAMIEELGEEEAYAEVFAEVFTHKGFYTHLSETFDGRSLGARIISRLVELVGKVQQLLKNPVAIRFEGKILFESYDMESLYEIMGDLIGGVPMKTETGTERLEGILSKDGKLNHNKVRHHTTAGYRTVDELKGYLATPALWLKGGTWDKIFAPGTKGYKGVMTNLENMIYDALDWISKVKPFAAWADWRANPDTTDLAQMVVNAPAQAEGEAYVKVVNKFKDVFKAYDDKQLEKMHDDFVRGVQVVDGQTVSTGGINVGTKGKPNRRGINKAKALGYSDAVIEVFQEYKTIADAIHKELAQFYPELNQRETHYGQSLRWKREDGTYLKEGSEAIVEDEFSRVEGNKSYMEGKNTQDTTRTIAESKGLKYDEIQPHKVFLAYVREANKLIYLGKMMEKGQKEGLIKIFANPREMAKDGFKPVNDPAFIISRMSLSSGFKVKVNEDTYWNTNGQDVVFSTRAEAQEAITLKLRPMDNKNIYSAQIEETTPDTVLTRHKYNVNRINSKGESVGVAGFDSEKLAQEYVDERYSDLKEGKDYNIEPAYAESKQVNVAEYGFHPDLARQLNNVLAKDWLMEAKFMGVSFKWLYDVKNHMTSIEFAVSMFHAATITQEAVATQTAWATQRYGIKKSHKGLLSIYDDSQDIHSLLMAVLENPKLADHPGIQKAANELFGTTDVAVLDVVNQFFLSGGLLHMDPTTRSSAHGLGEMRYYKELPTMEINPETVRFHNKRLFGKWGLGDLVTGVSPTEMGKSIKEVWDHEVKNEPDKRIKAMFNTMRFGALQGATSWLMETGIPKVKMAAFAREYTLQLDKQKAQIESGQVTKDKIARMTMKFVEDKFGEVNWKNQWMHPSLSTALKFLFRSFTWFTGSYKALSKAGIDIGKLGWFTIKQEDKSKPWNKQYELTSEGIWGITAVITHIMSVAMLTAGYHAALAVTGDDEVPDDPDTPWLTKLLYPRYDPSDPTARVTIPSYVTEGYKIMRHIGVIGDEPEFTKLVSGRFNSLLRNGYETIWTGTNWQGTLVRNPNDSLAEQGLDSFIHLFGVLPISLSAMKSQFDRKGFTPEVLVMSLVGMTDAPAAAKRSDAVNYGYHLSRGAHTTQKTEEEADQKAEIQRAQASAARGNKAPLLKLKKDGKISKRQYGRILKKIPRFGSQPNPAYVPEINRVVNLLTVPDTIKLIDKMSPHERKLTEKLIGRKYRNMVKRKEHGKEYVERQKEALRKLGYHI